MAFAPNLFLSNMRAKDGPAKPSRFEVILPIPTYINQFVSNSFLEQLINLPNTIVTDITDIFGTKPADEQSRSSNSSLSRYLALQCESAELPGKSLMANDAKIYGPTFKVPHVTQYNGDTTLTFLCTNDFYERKLFERWLEAISPSDTNNMRYPKGETTRYMTNIKIIQYDDFIKQIFAIELIDAFPISIASQPLAWSEDNFHRLSVQFAYQKYRVIYEGSYDLVQAAATILGLKTVNFTNNTGNSIVSGIGRATSAFGKIF
jgi:hypothetical protein